MTTLALGVCLVGRASTGPAGERVDLLTGVDSCWAGGEAGTVGLLKADPVFGTTFNGKPAMWPIGMTGRRVGSEIEVLDSAREVVATTGRRYFVSQARVAKPENVQRMNDLGAVPIGDCGYVWSFVDCTAAAAASPAAELQANYCGGG